MRKRFWFFSASIVLVLTCAVLWGLGFEDFVGLVVFYLAIAGVVGIVGFGAVILGTRMRKLSPYLSFGLGAGLVLLCFTGWACYNIATDTGWFAGLFGWIVLFLVDPVVVVIILIDVILYFINRKKKRKNNEVV